MKTESKTRFWLQMFFVVEAVALAIALITPLTPSKTGSKFRFSELFFEEPSFLHDVAVNYIVVNALIAILSVVFVVWVRLTKSNDQ